MTGRFLLPLLLLLSACTPLQRQLPPCWRNASFTNGQPITGRVTIIVGDILPDIMEWNGMTSVSPLTCEDGSFGILQPPARLTALAQPYDDSRPMFGSAFEAEIDATVRIIPSEGHMGRISPFYLELRSIRDLKRVDRPRWWRWN